MNDLENYKVYEDSSIQIYRFVLPMIDSNMYLVIDEDRAIIVDPNRSEDALRLIRKKRIQTIMVVLTHEHYDHISGIEYYRTGEWAYSVIAHKKTAENINNPRKNLSAFHEILMPQAVGFEIGNICQIDMEVEKEYDFQFGSQCIHIMHTPGHSEGSVCVMVSNNIVFSGDTLVDGNKTITRFPGGNRTQFCEITMPIIESWSDEIIILPGHGNKKRKREFVKELYG